MSDIAVLMVNYSTVNDFQNCLESMRTFEGDVPVLVFQNLYNREVSELSMEIARENDVMLFHNHHENRGHGFGINILADIATFPKYLFIVNPDVQWTEPVLDRLEGFLEEDPIRCIVGPKQMDSKHRITAGGIFGTYEKPEHRMFHSSDPNNVFCRDTKQCIMVAGSAFLISRKDFYSYGKMTEAHHFYSETFLNWHSGFHGRSNWYWGEPCMIHEWHTSSPMGHPGTDGKFHEDRELFRKLCDDHNPPIAHD